MRLLVTIYGLLTASLSACAQQPDEVTELRKAAKPEATVPGQVYTYVEQMPQLPGGGGQAAIALELMKRTRVRTVDLREQFSSHAAIYFEVSPNGAVQHVKLLQATGAAAVDSSLVTAARSLPRFTPGRQNGQPVTVGLTTAMTLCLQ